MLNDGLGDQILGAVRNHISQNYPFPIPEHESISIMGGDDEGVYAWIVNININCRQLITCSEKLVKDIKNRQLE